MNKHTFEVKDETFKRDVLESSTPVLVDFWADWCGPCKMIAPLVDDIANAYEGKLKVGKLDVDANPDVPQMYDIQGIPTLILFKNGQPVQRIVGFKPKERLMADLKQHLGVPEVKTS
jgi:thioredoxin 1